MAELETNIDELLDYLVSPEYLRMAADQQGEWNWRAAAVTTGHPVAAEDDGLADWERELLNPPVPLEPAPVPVQTPAPDTRRRFGIHWDTDSQTCVCPGCRARRRESERPSLSHEQRPVRLRSRSDGWDRFATVIEQRMPFTTSTGSLRGTTRPESTDSGVLRSKHAAAANLWTADQDKIDYVIYSYATPIAWHVFAHGGAINEWIYPDVTYSRTTSQHQAKIRRALLSDDESRVRYLQPEG